MTLVAGARLGPYEILSPLGAGGMGEVYRARDARLGREVAVKVLPSQLAGDTDALARFEREARAVAALSHPNILAIFDFGSDRGVAYAAMELLEGDTLRARLEGGALPPRKAVDWAVQIAGGLAAAHEKGVVHRDLKPENVFLTRDGRVKILDFGLARHVHAQPSGLEVTGTVSGLGGGTEPGTVMGTVGYMSPEQVRGQAADHRSDIFSFGAVLYEMLSGRRAFQGASAIETMNAILKEDPSLPGGSDRPLPASLTSIVARCLEKAPEERFQSARDLAFHLGTAWSDSGTSVERGPAAPRHGRRALLLGILALAATHAAVFVAGRRSGGVTPPSFHRATFRRGRIGGARYAPDGQTIVYGAAWDGQAFEVFSTRLGSPEARSITTGADLFAVSSSGEMALALNRRPVSDFEGTGTLAQASMSGGAPKELAEDVRWADLVAGGDGRLAVVRAAGGRDRLEFPPGRVLDETAGWLSHVRISPKGDRLAYIVHPILGDDGGSVVVVDRAGQKRTLATGFWGAQGLAWSPRGDEVWFTATRTGQGHALRAVSLSGYERIVQALAGWPSRLQDVASDGRVLLSIDSFRGQLVVGRAGETRERDLAWLEASLPMDLSADGRNVLFAEPGEGGGPTTSAYMRNTDGSPAVRLGDGIPAAFSPDGKWVLLILHAQGMLQVSVLPTGAGEKRALDVRKLEDVLAGAFLPDGQRLVLLGSERGHTARLYLLDAAGGEPKAISPEGMGTGAGWTNAMAVAPDGRSVAAVGSDGRLALFPTAGGTGASLLHLDAGWLPIRFTADGRELFVYRFGESPARIDRVDVVTGRHRTWKELAQPDVAGLQASHVQLTPDGTTYAYSYARLLSELYEVEGLR